MFRLYIVDILGQLHFIGEYGSAAACRAKEAPIRRAGYARIQADQGNPTERTIPYHAIVRFEIINGG